MQPRLLILICLSALPATADLKVRSTLAASGEKSETVLYTKKQRQRIEYGADAVLIQQCDRKRTLQLDPKSQSFFVIPPAAAAEERKGGLVTVQTTYTDTKETKPWFNFTARRILTKVQMTPSPASCEKQISTVETDGWYIDLPAAGDSCTVPAAPAQTGCKDEVKHSVIGSAKLGFPVAYTITTTTAGKAETVQMEVTELDAKSPLADSLFDVPAAYRDAAGRQAGVTRILVAFPGDKTGLGGGVLPNKIFKALEQPGLQPLAVAHSSPAEVDATAKQVGADYVLYAELAEVRRSDPPQPKGGKGFGKLVGKAAGLINQKEAWEARLDYRLHLPGSPSPIASASALGKTGAESFNVRGALNLATNVGMMMAMGGPMGMMMSRGGFMQSMMQMNQMGMGPGMGSGMGMGGLNSSLAGIGMMSAQNNIFQMSGGFQDMGAMAGANGPGMGQNMAQGMAPGMPPAMPMTPGAPNMGAPGANSSQDQQKAVQLAVAELARAIAEKIKNPVAPQP